MIEQNRWSTLSSELNKTYWGQRIAAEIEYLDRHPDLDHSALEPKLESAVEILEAQIMQDAAVSSATVERIEKDLSQFSEAAKSLTLTLIAHAHIDMNWMWGYDETVVIVGETMRTIISLMHEYKDLTFAQSQAAVYQIIEEYHPELIDDIRDLYQQGRWEFTSTQWVESDMNLPSTESLCRQHLYAIETMQRLFNAKRSDLEVTFLPDTFGHGVFTPELLQAAGVKYLYHCRGQVGPFASRWKAPSGASVIAYQDPRWYNEDIKPQIITYVPEMAKSYGLKTVLGVYGVGDHGGGPTRRDIHRILDMQSWPLAPKVTFGTYHSFFRTLENDGDIPEVTGERNIVFPGCYSSQARIKAGNKRGERALYNSELLNAVVQTGLGKHQVSWFGDAWKEVLFSQFHDILPGSGMPETVQYALGQYQIVQARSVVEEMRALRVLADSVSAVAAEKVREFGGSPPTQPSEDRSEGAGTGYFVNKALPGQPGRWPGTIRPFLVVNTVGQKRVCETELMLWDWPRQISQIEVVDSTGVPVKSAVVEISKDVYWSHDFLRLRIAVELPAFGYTVLFARPVNRTSAAPPYHPYGVEGWLQIHRPEYVLENDALKVTFDRERLALISMVEKSSGKQLINGAEHGAHFTLLTEELDSMSSWNDGRITSANAVGPNGKVVHYNNDQNSLVRALEFEAAYGTNDNSSIRVRFELTSESQFLKVSAATTFREFAQQRKEVPQLAFTAALPAESRTLLRDIPGGVTENPPSYLPQAALNLAIAKGEDGGLFLASENSHAFMLVNDRFTATLIRGTHTPEHAADIGTHKIELVLGHTRDTNSLAVMQLAQTIVPARTVTLARPGTEGSGSDRKTVEGSLLDAELDNCIVVAVKRAQSDPADVIIRLVASEEKAGSARVRFPQGVKAASVVDLAESAIESSAPVEISGDLVVVTLPAGSITTVRVGLAAS